MLSNYHGLHGYDTANRHVNKWQNVAEVGGDVMVLIMICRYSTLDVLITMMMMMTGEKLHSINCGFGEIMDACNG